MNVFDKAPVVDKEAFVAPSASVIGNVQVGRGSSIWYGCVLRGEQASVFLCLTDLIPPIVSQALFEFLIQSMACFDFLCRRCEHH